jgi:hypothetical protein
MPASVRFIEGTPPGAPYPSQVLSPTWLAVDPSHPKLSISEL